MATQVIDIPGRTGAVAVAESTQSSASATASDVAKSVAARVDWNAKTSIDKHTHDLAAVITVPTPFGKWLRTILWGAVLPVLLVILWDRLVLATGTRLIPRPNAVALMMWDFMFGGIYDDAFSKTFPLHLWESVKRVYLGFFIAAATAVPLGLLIGRVPLMRSLFDPLLALLRPIPVTAWLPLSMIFFGLGPNAAIFLVFLGAFYPILLNTVFGVRSADQRLFEAAAMLGCSGSQLFRAVVLPAALPTIFNGLRIGLSFAWILIVVGEMTGVPTGLGAVIMDGRNLSRTDLVICGMVIIGIAGFLSDRLVLVLNNSLLAWSPQHRG